MAGETEYYTISDLVPGTLYFFAIRAVDGYDNWSEISNVAWGTAPPDVCTDRMGNANCDPFDEATISDVSVMIDYLFLEGALCCPSEANINMDPDGVISIGEAR